METNITFGLQKTTKLLVTGMKATRLLLKSQPFINNSGKDVHSLSDYCFPVSLVKDHYCNTLEWLLNNQASGLNLTCVFN